MTPRSDKHEKKIGFDQIRQLVAGYCLSEPGKLQLQKIAFSNVFQEIQQALDLTAEMKTLLTTDDPFPSDDYYDLGDELARLNTAGTFIEIEEMNNLRLSYTVIQDIHQYIRQRQDKYPRLDQMASTIIIHSDVILKINRILNEKGQIRDDASEELKTIRMSMAAVQSQIGKRTRQILISLKKDDIIHADTEMTVRNGRCVIPMAAADKRRIKGFVHDESATGQTVFIEPAEIFEMNNQLRELENAERKAIIKILILFTDAIRPFLGELLQGYDFLATIDFIRAKALFAIGTNAVRPLLSPRPGLNWLRAVNPLLHLHLKEKNKKLVPYDINLNDKQRILVISGPNAGGKSVCLKTIGLLQYMIQCGFLIPVNEGSEAGIFSEIFIEIGDEQSIENDLSTYSSHLLNLKRFIENADEHTLFLIDEFGSGTEPILGGAIAEATLEALNNKKSFGAVTTHYANIKEFAAKTDGISNASMLFDTAKLLPLFKLNIGHPGSSYALEIADSIGFPKHITERATSIAGMEHISFEKQMKIFEADKEAMLLQQEKVRMADEFFSEMIDKYQTLLSELESQKKTIITEAQQQAALLLQNTNKAIENTIRQIKESGAEKEKTKQLRGELQELKEKIISEKNPEEIIIKPPVAKKQKTAIAGLKAEKKTVILQKGNFVRLPGQKNIGEILEVHNGQAQVLYDNIKIRIPVAQLEMVEPSKYRDFIKKKTRTNYTEISGKMIEKVAGFKSTLDVRGKRAEEITEIIEKYIDDALLLKIYNVRILHGKGSGVLRTIIHQLLSGHRSVVAFENEHVEHGGDGITVVSLK